MSEDYKAAVIAAIEAAGHKVTWKCVDQYDGETLHIDEQNTGLRAIAKGERVREVYVEHYRAVWRRRRLTGNAKKDAATLLYRHDVAIEMKAAEARRDQARQKREDLVDALAKALDVGGANVTIAHETTVSIRVPTLTIDQATRLGVRVRAILGLGRRA